MLSRKISTCLLLTVILTQSACGPKATAGGAIGGASGAIIGASIFNDTPVLGALFGSVIGGMLGSSIGAQLDANDREYMNQATMIAIQNNQGYEWRNDKSGNRGHIQPTNSYFDQRRKQYCREFTQTIVVGDQEQEGYGTACLQPDGSWRIVA